MNPPGGAANRSAREMTNIGAFEPIGAAREDVKRTGQVALTHEQRLKSIRWLGEGWFPRQIVLFIADTWGNIVEPKEIRALDPAFGANLPPDQFAIWRKERDRLERGEIDIANFGYRLALLRNEMMDAFHNNKPGTGVAILETINEMLKGSAGPQTGEDEPVEWVVRRHPNEAS